MYDAAERIKLIKQRARKLQQKRAKRRLRALFFLCLTLSLGIVRIFTAVAGSQHGAFVQDMTGATLMFEDAGAYVLVGVLSFTAAVIITILCLRHRHKAEIIQKEDSRQERSQAGDDGKIECDNKH